MLIRIVDDDEDLAESLKFLLEPEGWKVVSYLSAEDYLKSDAPSVEGCLLLDIRMPGLSGLELQEKMKRAGEAAFEALHMDVYARADFIVDESDGEIYCFEVNALPGMTSASLYPKAAKAYGLDYGDLCERIIEESKKARYH